MGVQVRFRQAELEMERGTWVAILRTIAEALRTREPPPGIALERSFVVLRRRRPRVTFTRGSSPTLPVVAPAAEVDAISGESIESAIRAAIELVLEDCD
jgi:hypothetical protein